MKKIMFLFLSVILLMVGCSNSQETKTEVNSPSADVKAGESNAREQADNDESKIIKIGTSALGKDLIEFIEPHFEEDTGYELELTVFEDFVMPNTATAEGSIDVNVYQYESFLDQYNMDNNTDLKSYGKTFGLLEGVYSSKYESLDDLEDGAKVGVIGSPSNKAVALRILQDEGLIKLDPTATMPNVVDITENPKNLDFIEMNDGRSLAMAIDDFDIIQTSGINMEMSGYDPTDSLAIASDDIHKELAYCIVVKEEDLDQEWLSDLEKALNSDLMSDYIEENFKGSYFLGSVK